MENRALGRRIEVLGETLGKLLRRDARGNIVRILGKVRPPDVAAALRNMREDERRDVFDLLRQHYPESAGEVLVDLDESQVRELVATQQPPQLAAVLETMPVDDAVWVVDTLPEEVREEVLGLVDFESRQEVETQLAYDEESAGRIMDTEFVAFPESTPVGEAILALQRDEPIENIFYLYVTSDTGHLVGVAPLRNLLLSRPQKTLGQIMKRNVIKVSVDTDQEEVAQVAARYDLLAIPVTDHENRLVGIVTVDDIIDIFKEEATEDFYRLAGTSEDELLYQDRPVRVAGIRLPWLFFNLVGGMITGTLLHRFQVSFTEALFLLTFVPVVMGMGGNVGTQTSTITVRGLATGRIALGQGTVRRFLWQQAKVGVVIGLACGVVVAGVALAIQRDPSYSLVVGLSLLVAMSLASVLGVLVPLLFERLNIDPAVASGPLVTTGNDITGILIYFSVAALLLDLIVR